MNYGFCELSVVPVRLQPGDQHEMTNQLIFGDLLIIKDEVGAWLLIETLHDQYEGWVDKKQILNINEEQYLSILNNNAAYLTDIYGSAISENNNHQVQLLMGSRLPNFFDDGFSYAEKPYKINTQNVDSSKQHHNVESIIQTAKKYMGVPYLWGGRSPFGIDCSGFMQIVFKICGIQLKRDAAQQVLQGEAINLIQEALPGDLAFFENKDAHIIHVGIILEDSRIIHASGEVRIDKLDHQGIYNATDKKYTHQLRTIKRLIPS